MEESVWSGVHRTRRFHQLRVPQQIEEIAAETAPFGRRLRVFTPDFSESSQP